MARRKSVLRPRRTREHVIASQSYNYVEKFFIDKGHTFERPVNDYGTDALVNTFDDQGYPEAGDVRIQLRASDNLDYSKDESYVSFRIERKHYEYWMQQVMPVLLIVYDAKESRAYWLYVQAYFRSKRIKANARSITVRIPTANRFTKRTVDYVRDRKAAILEQLEVGHE